MNFVDGLMESIAEIKTYPQNPQNPQKPPCEVKKGNFVDIVDIVPDNSPEDLTFKSSSPPVESKPHAQKLQNTLTETTDMQVKSVKELFDIQKQHAQKLQSTLTETTDTQLKGVQEMFVIQKQHAQNLQDVQTQHVQKIGQIQEQGTQAIMENYKKIETVTAQLANSMNDTVQEAQLYKQEVDKLSKNVAQINSIYANMLAAMTNK